LLADTVTEVATAAVPVISSEVNASVPVEAGKVSVILPE
jgi:hypothetical protein